MSFDQFIDKWLGKLADYDGYYGGQCVDIYRFYVKEVLGLPQSPGVGGATEIWDSADPDLYDFIDNEYPSDVVPQKGDILIWNRRVGGGFGHVAMFIEGDEFSFTSLDQNWPTLDLVTKTHHDYKNVIGWMRAKKTNNMPINEECDELRKERDRNWNLYQDQLKDTVALEENNGQLTEEITKYQSKMETADSRDTQRLETLSKHLSTPFMSTDKERSWDEVIAVAANYDKVIDTRDEYQDKYDREVSGRKEDRLEYQLNLQVLIDKIDKQEGILEHLKQQVAERMETPEPEEESKIVKPMGYRIINFMKDIWKTLQSL